MKLQNILIAIFFCLFICSCELSDDLSDDDFSTSNPNINELLVNNSKIDGDERLVDQSLEAFNTETLLSSASRQLLTPMIDLVISDDGLIYMYTFKDYKDQWGNEIEGLVKVTYNDLQNKVNRIVNYEDLYVNGNIYNSIKMIEGSEKTYFNEEGTKYIIERSERVLLTNGSVDFEDGSRIDERESLWGQESLFEYKLQDRSVYWQWERAGISSGKNRGGWTYANEINTPLLLTSDCVHSFNGIPTQGIIDFTFTNTEDQNIFATLDFGDGCDRKAELKISGQDETYSIYF
ncbi:hypothetical protein KMW28_10105 [Flammeovirga yaeyamensis]|uniref:Lipoprotein n=1 Tax=Flammeovirga yaeyamensis TaxID=367791 RepID=A0AAX1NC97_9BACT|nr:hypothetical protein [Flammeovirga yaeyamensis]MBB3698690.1 hypothetical protein [Flammeovirga yaeyamensis]QWG03905.1 hypothetical protein KMW28_10105 [Flammeovirga yaeyamensis]